MILQANLLIDWNTMIVAGTVASGTGALAMWINKQFAGIRKQFYDQLKEVYNKIDSFQKAFEDKLDYHERHDDSRFEAMSNNIWALRVRNAAKEGINLDRKKNKDYGGN